MKSPCYECSTRSLGCHGHCSLYKQFSEYNEAQKIRRQNEYVIESIRGDCLMRYKEKERRTPINLIRRK